MKFSISDPITIAKTIIFLIPVGIVLWLAAQYFSISGDLHISYDYEGESPFISEWTPRGRALDREQNLRTGEVYQQIVGEPAYMTVKVPRSYNSVDITVEYVNNGQPLTEFGLITSEEPWSVNLQPFQNDLIDQALPEWNRLEKNGVTLLQREQNYNSIDDFLHTPPKDQAVATYRYAVKPHYTDPLYTTQDTTLTIDRYLRGSHTFVTYVKDEPLHIEFDVVDMNRQFNADSVSLKITGEDIVYDETTLNDDGITDASGKLSETKTMTVDLPTLPEGAYTLQLQTTDDVVITQIRSTQHHFVAKDKVFVINNEEYKNSFPNLDLQPTTAYCNCEQFIVRTDHVTGIQTITVDKKSFEIAQEHVPYDWIAEEEGFDPSDGAREISIPKNDLLILTKGYISFTPDSFFDPDYAIQTIDQYTKLESLDYIIYTGYTAPEDMTRYNVQTVHMNLDGVAGDRKELQFLFSAPGIDHRKAMIQMNTIEFDFHREPLWDRIKKRLE